MCVGLSVCFLQEIGKVFDLLRTLKLLCQVLWKDKLSYLDELHLGTLLNMLKSAHYNARMNSLKEVCESFIIRTPRLWFPSSIIKDIA